MQWGLTMKTDCTVLAESYITRTFETLYGCLRALIAALRADSWLLIITKSITPHEFIQDHLSVLLKPSSHFCLVVNKSGHANAQKTNLLTESFLCFLFGCSTSTSTLSPSLGISSHSVASPASGGWLLMSSPSGSASNTVRFVFVRVAP